MNVRQKKKIVRSGKCNKCNQPLKFDEDHKANFPNNIDRYVCPNGHAIRINL